MHEHGSIILLDIYGGVKNLDKHIIAGISHHDGLLHANTLPTY